MPYLIHEDFDCLYCGRRPRRMKCSDCDAVGMVLTCEHANQPPPFEMIGRLRYCSECAADVRAETAANVDPMQGVMGAAGAAVGLGLGLGAAGMMFGALDGDGDMMLDL